MSQMFVRGIAELAESYVSVKRLQQFLQCDEVNHVISLDEKVLSEADNIAISVTDLKAKWDMNKKDLESEKGQCTTEKGILEKENLFSQRLTLDQINLCVKKGSLIGVIGPVGSGNSSVGNFTNFKVNIIIVGKSSFLQALLQELPLESGTININGSVSYASQEPWIFSGSVKQNVIFSNSFDQSRYDLVIRSCALDVDIENFKSGDKLLIGDRGISLSGGQKARIR